MDRLRRGDDTVAHRHNGSALRQIRTLFSSGTAGGLTDAQLLERFTARRAETAGAGAAAEAAFASLVDRHGAMVWGICRRITGDNHEAEDAFQATFLILARQAASLWVDDSLGRWLRRVARRVAVRARAEALRRRPPPGLARSGTAIDLGREAELEDLRTAVADVLGRLPEKYRAPVELCHLKGLKHDEAARLLGWPVGTVKSRLDRAKHRLREMLTRRGLAPAAASAASGETLAAVPAALVRRTVQAAVYASGGAGELPAAVLMLVRIATRAAIASRLKVAASVLWAGGRLGASAFALQGGGRGGARAVTFSVEGGASARGRVGRPRLGVGAPHGAARFAVQVPPTSIPVVTAAGPPRPRLPSMGVGAADAPLNPPVTSHEEIPRPEEDLGAAILKELRNTPHE